MSTISLRGISRTEAESFVANIWVVIEQVGVPSPRLEVKSLPGRLEDITAIFRSRMDADRVRHRVLAQLSNSARYAATA
jgi:hypothetical protein